MPKYKVIVDMDSPREEGEHLEAIFENGIDAEDEHEAEMIVDKKIKELTDTQAVELSRLTDQSTQQMELLNLNVIFLMCLFVSSFKDIIGKFEEDDETDAILMIGEIGGNAEEEAANFYKNHKRALDTSILIFDEITGLGTSAFV